MKQYLIADSGGTKTDWCFVDENGKLDFFSTESYHPAHFTEDFFARIKLFWDKFHERNNTEVYFFGAGCFNTENCEEIKLFFKSLDFLSVNIFSDLQSSAIACYGEANGRIAILGTGSVLFDWENQKIIRKIGGKGHLIGDEGSGYSFGKLIINALAEKRLNDKQLRIVNSTNAIHLDLSDKYNVANISKELMNEKDVFLPFHRLNIKAFIETHHLKSELKKLSIVGSYGFYHQDIISSVFEEDGIEVSAFIEKPISLLVEHRRVFID